MGEGAFNLVQVEGALYCRGGNNCLDQWSPCKKCRKFPILVYNRPVVPKDSLLFSLLL